MQQTYETATGKIDFTLKNNYMFQVVLQNIDILNGLLCSLLDLKPEEIAETRILNPIVPGEEINTKTFILDIHILLNNSQQINLEMQVENEKDWPDRSLNYLCRSFDNLLKGENYTDVRAAIHIGILNFDLFPEHLEFYSNNKLMNVKTHEIYNDKFQLRVLSLRQIERATEEDKAAGRDKWAALFRAETWEELRMAAGQNPYMTAAAEKLYDSNADYIIQERARTLEDNLRKERRIRRQFAEQAAALAEQAAALADKDAEIAALRAQIEQLKKQ